MESNEASNVENSEKNGENVDSVVKDGAEALKSAEEKDEWKNKYYYLAAEFENTKKRFDREKSNLVKFGNENVLGDLIEVVDNFDRTMDYLVTDTDPKVKNIVVGIEMVRKQFVEVLSRSGLKEIKALGEIFDPNFHEAVAQESVEGKKDHEIVTVHQKGYELNGRVLRASKVVVAKN